MANTPLQRSTIGRRIASVRVLRGLRQGDLADRAGVHINALARAEQDKTTPTLPTLERLHRALECPVGYLLSGEGAPGEPEGAE